MRTSDAGNFSVDYSTESHVAASWEALGHEVVRIQEGIPAHEVPALVAGCDVFLHTQTYGYAVTSGLLADRFEASQEIADMGIPRVFFHLDRWWGLARADQLGIEPWSRYELVVTADGGHEQEWKSLGINHHWMPPAVFHGEARDGRHRPRCDVIFVGSWRNYGHPEWEPYRLEMLDKVRSWYGSRFQCWPRARAVRGMALNDLYGSAKVAIGDSCLAGSPERYWSDRIPETLGRGGFLIHPAVKGLELVHPYVPTYELGDWDRLRELLNFYVSFNDDREAERQVAAADVRTNHTYKNRMAELLDELYGRGLL